jgi:hypothetical protein
MEIFHRRLRLVAFNDICPRDAGVLDVRVDVCCWQALGSHAAVLGGYREVAFFVFAHGDGVLVVVA